MSVSSNEGTSHMNSLYVDHLWVGGTLTGSVLNAGTESITQVVETNISAAGTITGSVIKGTLAAGIVGNDVANFASLKGTSFYALVGTIVGSQAHGLAASPTAVMIAPVMDFGTFGAPYQRAAADGTNCFVSAGTTGTVQITAIA